MKISSSRQGTDNYSLYIHNLTREQKADILRHFIYVYSSEGLDVEISSAGHTPMPSRKDSSSSPKSPPPPPKHKPSDFPKDNTPPSSLELMGAT